MPRHTFVGPSGLQKTTLSSSKIYSLPTRLPHMYYIHTVAYCLLHPIAINMLQACWHRSLKRKATEFGRSSFKGIVERSFESIYVIVGVRLELKSLLISIHLHVAGIDVQAELALRVQILAEFVE